jgi:hypothetical protein
MSHLILLSRGKISRILKTIRESCQRQPRDVWRFLVGFNLIGILGALTTYPGAILVTAAVSITVILSPDDH